jgi:hypothetical protein
LCCRPGTPVKLLWPAVNPTWPGKIWRFTPYKALYSPSETGSGRAPAGTTKSSPTALVRGEWFGGMGDTRHALNLTQRSPTLQTLRDPILASPLALLSRCRLSKTHGFNAPASASPPSPPWPVSLPVSSENRGSVAAAEGDESVSPSMRDWKSSLRWPGHSLLQKASSASNGVITGA